MKNNATNNKKGIRPQDCQLMQEAVKYMLFNPALNGKTMLEVDKNNIPLWTLKPDIPPRLAKGFKTYQKLQFKISSKTLKDFNKAIADDENAAGLILEFEKYMFINPEAQGKTLHEVWKQEIPIYIIKADIAPDLAIAVKKYEDIRDDIHQKANEYYICGNSINDNNI